MKGWNIKAFKEKTIMAGEKIEKCCLYKEILHLYNDIWS